MTCDVDRGSTRHIKWIVGTILLVFSVQAVEYVHVFLVFITVVSFVSSSSPTFHRSDVDVCCVDLCTVHRATLYRTMVPGIIFACVRLLRVSIGERSFS